jgi:hypothetical protein
MPTTICHEWSNPGPTGERPTRRATRQARVQGVRPSRRAGPIVRLGSDGVVRGDLRGSRDSTECKSKSLAPEPTDACRLVAVRSTVHPGQAAHRHLDASSPERDGEGESRRGRSAHHHAGQPTPHDFRNSHVNIFFTEIRQTIVPDRDSTPGVLLLGRCGL